MSALHNANNSLSTLRLFKFCWSSARSPLGEFRPPEPLKSGHSSQKKNNYAPGTDAVVTNNRRRKTDT